MHWESLVLLSAWWYIYNLIRQWLNAIHTLADSAFEFFFFLFIYLFFLFFFFCHQGVRILLFSHWNKSSDSWTSYMPLPKFREKGRDMTQLYDKYP